MVLPTAASAVVIKRKPKCGNDELRGNDDGKSYDPSVARGDRRAALSCV
jgi:hypothetical protein